jgi:uncharacterized SAM-binding protein YcdF (DUF218 family)
VSVLATAAVASLLMPPLLFVLAALAGTALLASRRRRLGLTLILLSLGTLTLLSTPFVSERLLRSLEPPALAPATIPGSAGGAAGRPQAIVILGGGLNREAPEYGGDSAGGATLERLRYGAWLHRRTGLPILVSGGRPLSTRLSEADTMRDSLSADFRATPRWVEGESLNTRENASYARVLLSRDAIDRIYLVTHASHMPRARRAFERAGFQVTAAPTAFTALTPGALAWVPSGQSLRNSHIAWREWLGEAWYRLNS